MQTTDHYSYKEIFYSENVEQLLLSRLKAQDMIAMVINK